MKHFRNFDEIVNKIKHEGSIETRSTQSNYCKLASEKLDNRMLPSSVVKEKDHHYLFSQNRIKFYFYIAKITEVNNCL